MPHPHDCDDLVILYHNNVEICLPQGAYSGRLVGVFYNFQTPLIGLGYNYKRIKHA